MLVEFVGEEGIDSGGLKREFFRLLFQQMQAVYLDSCGCFKHNALAFQVSWLIISNWNDFLCRTMCISVLANCLQCALYKEDLQFVSFVHLSILFYVGGNHQMLLLKLVKYLIRKFEHWLKRYLYPYNTCHLTYVK